MQRKPKPVQDRSRRTLEQILATAEESAVGGGFEELSIREICKRSGVTTGAFYAHFQKKDDLAVALFESIADEFRALVDDHIVRRQSHSLQASIRPFLTNIATLYRRHAGLLHALTTKAGSSRELATTMRRHNSECLAELVAAPYPEDVHHPEPSLALRLGFLSVFVALKEIVLDQRLFDDVPPIDDERLVDELTKIFCRYVVDNGR